MSAADPSAAATVTLADLRPGDSGTVAGYVSYDAMAQRLMALGLVDGTPVKLIRTAPAGDPYEVDVAGYSLSVRKSEAAHVKIARTS